MADSRNEKILELVKAMAGDPDRAPVVRQTELIDRLIPEGGMFFLTLEDLNELLLYLGFKTVTESFFERFFPNGIASPETLEEGVDAVRKRSMLYFGNLQYGFETLARQTDVRQFLDKALKVPNLAAGPARTAKMTGIQGLAAKEAYALGYATESVLDPERLERAKTTGMLNAEKYLAMDPVDVYIAASMRKLKDFEEADRFIASVFESERLEPLKLRYFNPLVAYLDDPVEKGLMESLMLKKASVMIYLVGRRESFGKDVELASMLVQGKPVIVYTPNRKKAKLLRERHPLRFQVELTTGVAHGLIVAQSPGTCVEVLHDLFTHSLQTYIGEDSFNYFLYEKNTRSQVRVVTKNPYLTNAFWNSYLEHA